MKKLPPIEKIYEAYSAIADERVTLFEDYATILSSNKAKEYFVTWKENVYAANDSATYWQGYAGYPVIAVLMLQNKLPLNMDIAHKFKDINWTKLNAASKRNYAKVVEDIFKERNYDNEEEIIKEVEQVFEALKELDIQTKRSTKRPTKFPEANKEESHE